MSFCRYIVASLLVLNLGSAPASLNAGERGVAFVERLVDRLSGVLEKEDGQSRTKKLLKEVDRHFNYKAFEQRVLIDSRKKFTTAQHRRFSKEFKTLFEKKMLSASNNPEFVCDRYNVHGGNQNTQVTVSCIQNEDEHAIILHLSGTKIVDLTMSGALLSRNYRGTINKMIRRDGVDALIERVAEQNEKTPQTNTLL